MDKNNSEQLLNIINGILSDYVSTCGVEPFVGKVIIADDMADSYKKIRNDLVEKGKHSLATLRYIMELAEKGVEVGFYEMPKNE